MSQPTIADLFGRYLSRQSASQVAGMAQVTDGEVEAYDAAPVQPVDPKLAWDEACVALADCGGAKGVKAPADWASLVATQESQTALPLAAGHYPQAVRDLMPLYRAASPAELPVKVGTPVPVPALTDYAVGGSLAQSLLAAGAFRLARQYDAALAVLRDHANQVPESLRTVWANEEASTLWLRGDRAAADRIWQSLPETAAVLFNRGLAALFLGRKGEGRTALTAAVAMLPESSGWHHLGRLYLALAQS